MRNDSTDAQFQSRRKVVTFYNQRLATSEISSGERG